MYIDALLTPNKWSRSGKHPRSWDWIVLHWFLAAGQPARSVRDYWDSRAGGERDFGSGHVAVGEEGALLCVPFSEVAYHVGTLEPTPWAREHIGGWFNYHCLAIEMEHPDLSGKPTERVWDTAVRVAADMAMRFDIDSRHIITHYDITGMQAKWNGLPCHRWFVEQEGELKRFRDEVAARLRRSDSFYRRARR